jgi:hypothetical protein
MRLSIKEIFFENNLLLFHLMVINIIQAKYKLVMKNTNLLPTDPYADILPEESSSQFMVRPIHIIFTAALLVAWAWLGTVIIG